MLLVCGVDEAGRGPLAGPVYAAAVILDPDRPIIGLDDSKRLSERKREALAPLIRERALSWSIASASVEEIDAINILQATMLAMRRAVETLPTPATEALIDGNRCPPLRIPARALIGGDALEPAISAASILAKTAGMPRCAASTKPSHSMAWIGTRAMTQHSIARLWSNMVRHHSIAAVSRR
jgi:ribonuclease HII